VPRGTDLRHRCRRLHAGASFAEQIAETVDECLPASVDVQDARAGREPELAESGCRADQSRRVGVGRQPDERLNSCADARAPGVVVEPRRQWDAFQRTEVSLRETGEESCELDLAPRAHEPRPDHRGQPRRQEMQLPVRENDASADRGWLAGDGDPQLGKRAHRCPTAVERVAPLVHREPVDASRGSAAPEVARTLEDDTSLAASAQQRRRGKTTKPTANDGNVCMLGHLLLLERTRPSRQKVTGHARDPPRSCESGREMLRTRRDPGSSFGRSVGAGYTGGVAHYLLTEAR